MENEFIFITCAFNGTLSIGTNNVPCYDGGVVKPLMVRKSCTYEELVRDVYMVTEINPSHYRIRLVCSWPITDSRNSAIQITNDRDTTTMLTLSRSQRSIELFVEKEPLNIDVASQCRGEFSRMLDMENDSTGFLSSPIQQQHSVQNMGNTYNSWNAYAYNIGGDMFNSTYFTEHQETAATFTMTNPTYMVHNPIEEIPHTGVSDHVETTFDAGAMNIEQSEDGSEEEDVGHAQGEDSMYYAVQDDENDVEWIDNAYANNHV